MIRCSETWPESNNLDNCFVGYPCKELFFSSLPRFPIMFVYFDLTLKNVVEIVNVLIVYGFLKKELLRQHQCALIIMELICKSDNPLVDRLKNFKNPIDFCFWGDISQDNFSIIMMHDMIVSKIFVDTSLLLWFWNNFDCHVRLKGDITYSIHYTFLRIQTKHNCQSCFFTREDCKSMNNINIIVPSYVLLQMYTWE